MYLLTSFGLRLPLGSGKESFRWCDLRRTRRRSIVSCWQKVWKCKWGFCQFAQHRPLRFWSCVEPTCIGPAQQAQAQAKPGPCKLAATRKILCFLTGTDRSCTLLSLLGRGCDLLTDGFAARTARSEQVYRNEKTVFGTDDACVLLSLPYLGWYWCWDTRTVWP